MADPDRTGPALGDVLRALGQELQRGEAAGVHVEQATLDLAVVLEPGADGAVGLRVAGPAGGGREAGGKEGGGRSAAGKGGGGKGGRATRLTLTVRPGARPAAGQGPVTPTGAATSSAAADAGSAPGGVSEPVDVRPSGFLDVLADALKSLADTATTPTASPWPIRTLPREKPDERSSPPRHSA